MARPPSRGVDGGQKVGAGGGGGKKGAEVEGSARKADGRRLRGVCGTLRLGGGHVRRSQWVRGSGTETEKYRRGPMSETGGRAERKKTSRMFSQHPQANPNFFQPVSGR